MFCILVFATLTLLVRNDFAGAQQIPLSTTAAELWNPWTWFWPYAIATAEGYRDYYQKAQKATNELYQQIYKTNAFPWMLKPTVTGDWSSPGKAPDNSTQPNQEGKNQNNSTQTGQGGNSGASNQTNSMPMNQEQTNQNTNEKPPQEEQNNQSTTENSGAQVQGNVQNDGTANAEVNS